MQHDDTPPPFDPATLAEFAELADDVQRAFLNDTRYTPRLRRALRALSDLSAPVPEDWITVDDDGNATFATLPAQAFDRLVCLLEDLAEHRPVEVTVVRTGPTLFGPIAPRGPTNSVPAPSSVHPVINR